MQRLGGNLRIARIRRGISIQEAAERIGTGRRAVMDAEKGKPSTGMVVYAALLWLYHQIDQFEDLADPAKDEEGLLLELARAPSRADKKQGLDRDF